MPEKPFKGGWNQVKLYFMLGLPTETEDDMKGIAHLAQKIAEELTMKPIPKEQRKGKVQINVEYLILCTEAISLHSSGLQCSVKQDFIEKAKIVKR